MDAAAQSNNTEGKIISTGTDAESALSYLLGNSCKSRSLYKHKNIGGSL